MTRCAKSRERDGARINPDDTATMDHVTFGHHAKLPPNFSR